MSTNAPGFKPVATASLLTERLAAFIPPLLLPDPAAAGTSFEGVILAVEVEGFSALAESLARLGREGAETLGRTLNHYFSPLIEIINREGGQVITLDGSGLQAFFSANEPDQFSRTATVALEILDQAATFHPVQTPEGRYSFGMRAGLGQGKLIIVQLGDTTGGMALVVMGEAVDQGRQAAAQAAWGEAFGWLGGPLKPAGQNEFSGRPINPNLTFYFGDEDQTSIYSRLAPYIPRSLAHKFKVTPDLPVHPEFRRVVNVFIILPELDLTRQGNLSVLQDFYGTLQRVCNGLDGRVHQITANPEDNSVYLHLTFGALITSSEDAENALRAILSVRDLAGPSGALPAISIASGTVFTGVIGTPTCQRYTVLGEVVKLSCQLAKAGPENGPGILPVDRYTRERVGLSYIFGDEISIKIPDQAAPVRVRPLLARRPQPCNLASYLKEVAFNNNAEFSGLPEKLLAGEKRVFVQSEAGRFYPLAQDWLKWGGIGAVGKCQPNAASNVPYLAWSGLVSGLIGLNETDSRTEKSAKLAQVISRYSPDSARFTGVLGQFVGLLPEQPGFHSQLGGPLREEFAKIIIDLLRGLAQAKPLLILINNMQWSDEPSRYLLEQATRELADAPVIFGLTSQRGNPVVDACLDALA